MKTFDKRALLFIIIFTVLGVIFLQVKIAKIIGSSQSFTLFDYLGPTSGLYLGPVVGGISVFFVKMTSLIINHGNLDWLTAMRFLPMIMAAVYLGTKSKNNVIVPIVCMILFILHPQGRLAWYYSLYWLIPVFATFKKERLILNALGSTFTAHAVGSVIFLYAFNLSAAVWISLIPIVAVERGLFALGIWSSYTVINTALEKIDRKYHFPVLKRIVNPKYTFSKNFIRRYA